MSESEPIHFPQLMNRAKQDFKPIGISKTTQNSSQSRLPVAFNRLELNLILNIYGRRVATGEWRDYAIDMLSDVAVFSIFRHACEMPLYRIEKNPKLAKKQGAYQVITPTGLIIRRGHDLEKVLRVLEPKPRLMQV